MKHPLLTITQASRATGVSRQTIYQAIAQKRLPARQQLGRFVVREAEIYAAKLGKAKPGPTLGRPMTAAHKAAIAEAQRRRWASRKSEM